MFLCLWRKKYTIIIVSTFLLVFWYNIKAAKNLQDLDVAATSLETGENGAAKLDLGVLEPQYVPKELLETDQNEEGVKKAPTNALRNRETSISTVKEFTNFDFSPAWMTEENFFTDEFEQRYQSSLMDFSRPPLKIILVPHSHIDQGSQQTSEGQEILTSVVRMLANTCLEMTFIWKETSFLQYWWDQATQADQTALRYLIVSGRFEVVTDRSTDSVVHLFGMLEQLTEGHQWLQTTLKITPTSAWSINDPLPYLLASSDIESAVIQRSHFGWRNWLASKQKGDFEWFPSWESSGIYEKSLLTHVLPFELCCGPKKDACNQLDFRLEPLNSTDVPQRARIMFEMHSRMASLFPHNVALIPLGDDLSYQTESEVEQQYEGYMKLRDFINTHKDEYNGTEVSFGTLRDYFKSVRERMQEFASLQGDFLPYAESPLSHWTGYYSTRPYNKVLTRTLEAHLRSTEITFSAAWQLARKSEDDISAGSLKNSFEKLVHVRQNMSLFQHQGVFSTASDYSERLLRTLRDLQRVQELSIEYLIQTSSTETGFVNSVLDVSNLQASVIEVTPEKPAKVILFNPLGQRQLQMVKIRTTTASLKVVDPNEMDVQCQVNPVWDETMRASETEFEVLFFYDFPALSLVSFTVKHDADDSRKNAATLFCHDCGSLVFQVKSLPSKNVRLVNDKMKVLFDTISGSIQSVLMRATERLVRCEVAISAYQSNPLESGTNHFRLASQTPLPGFLEHVIGDQNATILLSVGPIAGELTVFYGSRLTHQVALYSTHSTLDDALYIESTLEHLVDDTEMFLRFSTDIQNGDPPEIFTDQNGFQYQRRVKVPGAGVEGNYYPITQAAFIQDDGVRLTLLTDHAQGVASLETGELEVMLERRLSGEGLRKGMQDNRRHTQKLRLIVEESPSKLAENDLYQLPSLYANRMANSLNYPLQAFVLNETAASLELLTTVELLDSPMPCDLHLVNLRTSSDLENYLLPSESVLLTLQRQGMVRNRFSSVEPQECGKEELSNRFMADIEEQSLWEVSVTGTHEKRKLLNISEIEVFPMEVRTFRIRY